MTSNHEHKMLYSVFHIHPKVTIEKCYILAKVMYEARIDRAAAGREVNMLKKWPYTAHRAVVRSVSSY